jgi:hypothetical protein
LPEWLSFLTFEKQLTIEHEAAADIHFHLYHSQAARVAGEPQME